MLAEVESIGVVAAYGGKELAAQIKKLNGQCHMVIGTPGRVIDHLERGNIQLDQLATFVIDEADEMLMMGFRNEIDTIIEYQIGRAHV